VPSLNSNMSINSILQWIIVAMLFVVFIFYYINSVKKKKKIPYLNEILISLGIFYFLKQLSTELDTTVLTFELLKLAYHFFGILRDWYVCLFFASLNSKKYLKFLKNLVYTGYVVSTSILITDTILVIVYPYEEAHILAYNLWNLSSGIMGVIVFGVFGAIMYFEIYMKTKEKLFIPIGLGCLCGALAWGIHGYRYIVRIVVGHELIQGLNSFESYLAIIALVIVIIVYGRNLDLTFRLQSDIYTFIIKHKNGIAIYKANIENSANIVIQEDLIAGFLTAINNMFVETLHSKLHIDEISSGDSTIIMRSTKIFTAIIIGKNSPEVLEYALANFVGDFGEVYKDLLDQDVFDLNEFSGTDEILIRHFPFFKINKKF
jgi:hypothetical protein